MLKWLLGNPSITINYEKGFFWRIKHYIKNFVRCAYCNRLFNGLSKGTLIDGQKFYCINCRNKELIMNKNTLTLLALIIKCFIRENISFDLAFTYSRSQANEIRLRVETEILVSKVLEIIELDIKDNVKSNTSLGWQSLDTDKLIIKIKDK